MKTNWIIQGWFVRRISKRNERAWTEEKKESQQCVVRSMSREEQEERSRGGWTQELYADWLVGLLQTFASTIRRIIHYILPAAIGYASYTFTIGTRLAMRKYQSVFLFLQIYIYIYIHRYIHTIYCVWHSYICIYTLEKFHRPNPGCEKQKSDIEEIYI